MERKKARAGYQAYDEEAELEAAALGHRPVLAKYDDTIEPRAAASHRGFLIGDEAAAHDAADYRQKMMVRRSASCPHTHNRYPHSHTTST